MRAEQEKPIDAEIEVVTGGGAGVVILTAFANRN